LDGLFDETGYKEPGEPTTQHCSNHNGEKDLQVPIGGQVIDIVQYHLDKQNNDKESSAQFPEDWNSFQHE